MDEKQIEQMLQMKELAATVKELKKENEKLEKEKEQLEKKLSIQDSYEKKYIDTHTELSDLKKEHNLLKATPKIEIDRSDNAFGLAMIKHAKARKQLHGNSELRIHQHAIASLLSHIRGIDLHYDKMNKEFEIKMQNEKGQDVNLNLRRIFLGDGDYQITFK